MFPVDVIQAFPMVARGHGSRKVGTIFEPQCSRSECQMYKRARGKVANSHTFDRVANYRAWMEEREFGERVEDTLKKYAVQEGRNE